MNVKAILAGTAVAVATVAAPGSAEAAAKYPVSVYWYFDGMEQGYPVLRIDVSRADTGKPLRYIPACLQRSEGDGWDTRSCHKTSANGATKWLLYEGYEYRIHIPSTAYHYSMYSDSFTS